MIISHSFLSPNLWFMFPKEQLALKFSSFIKRSCFLAFKVLVFYIGINFWSYLLFLMLSESYMGKRDKCMYLNASYIPSHLFSRTFPMGISLYPWWQNCIYSVHWNENWQCFLLFWVVYHLWVCINHHREDVKQAFGEYKNHNPLPMHQNET